MPRISIAALIYRSTRFADSVWESLHEFTPELHDLTSDVEFFFVANDAEPHLLKHLHWQDYPHVAHHNRRHSEEWLFAQGYAKPEYISRVYAGWNRAIMESDEICVLVNSDHLFSPGWLPELLAPLLANDKLIVCSQSVEPPDCDFNGAWSMDFGRTPATFRKAEFLEYAAANRQPGVMRSGGVYMPCAFYRKYAIGAGLYPEGNLHGGSYDKIAKSGDTALFERMHERYGIEHVTAMGSIVYHFHEGEMRE